MLGLQGTELIKTHLYTADCSALNINGGLAALFVRDCQSCLLIGKTVTANYKLDASLEWTRD